MDAVSELRTDYGSRLAWYPTTTPRAARIPATSTASTLVGQPLPFYYRQTTRLDRTGPVSTDSHRS